LKTACICQGIKQTIEKEIGMMLKKNKQTEAQDWNHFWGKEKSTFSKVSWSKKRILNLLQSYLDQDKKILDAGCGSGFFSKTFCDLALKTVSIDYSDEALGLTEKMTEGRACVIKKDLLLPGLSEEIGERFDVIFSDGLLEHFSAADQKRIFMNLVSLLADEGVVITFVPNQWSPWQLVRPLMMPGIKETPFVLEDLVDLNQESGLKVIDKGGINVFPVGFSPDKYLGPVFGMLLYIVAEKL